MRYILNILLLVAGLNASSQPKAVYTSVPDTSFSNRSAFESAIKSYPAIQLAEELHTSIVIEKKNLVYCKLKTGRTKRKLLLDAFYPSVINSKEKRAAILILHGGGWRSGNRTQHYPLAQRLAALGYVCFTPEYRLSTEAVFPAAVDDVKAAIGWVRQNAKAYNIDTSKVVLLGFSAGGELAAYTASKTFSLVNALVDIDGILAFIHPESGEGDDSKKTSAATYWFGYSKSENPSLWIEGSPLTHVGKHSPPTLFINSSVARMHAGRNDFIDKLSANNIYSEVHEFKDAPHAFCLFHPWIDPTVKYIDEFLKKIGSVSSLQDRIVVAADGSGNYITVQKAFDAIPLENKKKITIFIKNGTYREKLFLDSTKDFVTIIGEDKFNTILTFDDHTGKLTPSGDTINTRTSWSCRIKANNFTAKNITFQNTAGFTAGQAVALEVNGDRISIINCRITGNQDVLFTNTSGGRQYYRNCYIEGTTDFIFGAGTAWFEQCHIHSTKNSHITAAATPADQPFGYIFNDCVLTGDTSLHNVSLGRPWRPYAAVVFLRTYIGPHIKPEGWSNWNNTENYKTARYGEFANYGEGADLSKRLPWIKQLTKTEADKYTIRTVFKNWNPSE